MWINTDWGHSTTSLSTTRFLSSFHDQERELYMESWGLHIDQQGKVNMKYSTRLILTARSNFYLASFISDVLGSKLEPESASLSFFRDFPQSVNADVMISFFPCKCGDSISNWVVNRFFSITSTYYLQTSNHLMLLYAICQYLTKGWWKR
jgi:hypothetical protein